MPRQKTSPLVTDPPVGNEPGQNHEKLTAPTCHHVWVELSGPDDPFDRNKNRRKTVIVKCLHCHTQTIRTRKAVPHAPTPHNSRTGY